jgi:hypothetical protein
MKVFDPKILVERYLLSEKTKNSERSDENKLTMANVVETGHDQLMVQVRRVENYVANAQSLFLIRKYEDEDRVCLATLISHDFDQTSYRTNYPTLTAFCSPFSMSPKMALKRYFALLCCCE